MAAALRSNATPRNRGGVGIGMAAADRQRDELLLERQDDPRGMTSSGMEAETEYPSVQRSHRARYLARTVSCRRRCCGKGRPDSG